MAKYKPVPPVEHRFKPGQSGNPKGRAPNPIPNALKKLTRQQYRRIIIAITKGNIDHLKAVVKDEKSSALEVSIAACYIKAIERGDYSTVEKMLQRVFGKVPDEILVRSRNTTLTGVLDNEKVKAAIQKWEEEI